MSSSIKRWAAALALLAGLSGASAAGFLVSGGALSSSTFCKVYGCTLVGTEGGQRAYRLGKDRALGVVSRVSGGRVTGMTFVVLDPDKVSNQTLSLALSSGLPDFQTASLGARHAFKVSQQCLRAATAGKAVQVNGHRFTFSCAYGPQVALARLYRVPASTRMIAVSYSR